MNGFRLCCQVSKMTWLRRFSNASGGSCRFHCLSTDSLPMAGAVALATWLFGSRSAKASPPAPRNGLETAESSAAGPPHRHVEDHPGDVTLDGVARLEGVAVAEAAAALGHRRPA